MKTISNRKIKVLVIMEQLSLSYKYFENIFIEINRTQCCELEVLNLVNNEEVNTHLSTLCSKLYTLPKEERYISHVLTIRDIIKKSNPDVIHAHEMISAFYASLALLSTLSRKKLIFHRHHSYYSRKMKRVMERVAFLRCDLSISVSKATQEQAIREHPFSKEKIVLLYNGITIKQEKNEVPIDLSRFEGMNKILLLARLKPRKGHLVAIEAMKIVLKSVPDAVLFFAGNGEFRKEIENNIKNNNLENNIILLGDIKDPGPVIKQIQISILPSESEAFNLSILETMACKKLSIASDLPSIRECIEDRVSGVLTPVGNSAMLAKEIIFFLQNPEEREIIGQNAYNLFNEKFTTAIMVKQLNQIYTDLVDNK